MNRRSRVWPVCFIYIIATTQQCLVTSPQDPGVVSLHVNAGQFSTTARRVTSPTWDPPPPCKQALNVPVKSKLQHPRRAYPGHLTSFLAWEGGNLITTHRGWGIWLLASMSCYEMNHGGDSGDVKLWWIQRKRLRICDGLVENQRLTQAVLRIWRCLRLIYIYSM